MSLETHPTSRLFESEECRTRQSNRDVSCLQGAIERELTGDFASHPLSLDLRAAPIASKPRPSERLSHFIIDSLLRQWTSPSVSLRDQRDGGI